MSTESVKEEIKRELPAILRADPEFRAYILELTRQSYADRAETQDRFWEMVEQMNRDREEQRRKWEEQNRKWDANQAELQRMREEQAAKWEEQNRKWEANQAELRAMREEQKLVWAENQAELKRLHEENMAYARKFDRSIRALGARWG